MTKAEILAELREMDEYFNLRPISAGITLRQIIIRLDAEVKAEEPPDTDDAPVCGLGTQAVLRQHEQEIKALQADVAKLGKRLDALCSLFGSVSEFSTVRTF